MPNPPTDRMGLVRPLGNESMGSGATSASTVLTGNYGKIDGCAGILSSANPTAVVPSYEGRMFLSTVDFEYWFRESVRTYAVGSYNKNQISSKGDVYMEQRTPDIAGAETMGMTKTFNAINGRRTLLKIKCFNRAPNLNNTRAIHRIRYAAGGTVTTAGTLVETVNLQLPVKEVGKTWSTVLELPSTLNGTHTVGWSLESPDATLLWWWKAQLSIQDFGVLDA